MGIFLGLCWNYLWPEGSRELQDTATEEQKVGGMAGGDRYANSDASPCSRQLEITV